MKKYLWETDSMLGYKSRNLSHPPYKGLKYPLGAQTWNHTLIYSCIYYKVSNKKISMTNILFLVDYFYYKRYFILEVNINFEPTNLYLVNDSKIHYTYKLQGVPMKSGDWQMSSYSKTIHYFFILFWFPE